MNGRNLGRYWNIGPQKSLYIPGPWLFFGKNQIVIFEEEKDGDGILFHQKPVYDF